ncbi:hypothetical protein GN958_ATG07612, partial [Phytophthora infestans]
IFCDGNLSHGTIKALVHVNLQSLGCQCLQKPAFKINSMGRTCVTGSGRRRKQYKRMLVAYGDKKCYLDYHDKAHNVKECIKHFCGVLPRKDHRAKEKLICKPSQVAQFGRRHICYSRKQKPKSCNESADAGIKVFPFRASEAKQVSPEYCSPADNFLASATWIKIFVRRHKLSLRTRTRQGQTTPQDAAVSARNLRALVLQIVVELNCTKILNAYVPKETTTSKGSKTI